MHSIELSFAPPSFEFSFLIQRKGGIATAL
jgi:hypothetical protein